MPDTVTVPVHQSALEQPLHPATHLRACVSASHTQGSKLRQKNLIGRVQVTCPCSAHLGVEEEISSPLTPVDEGENLLCITTHEMGTVQIQERGADVAQPTVHNLQLCLSASSMLSLYTHHLLWALLNFCVVNYCLYLTWKRLRIKSVMCKHSHQDSDPSLLKVQVENIPTVQDQLNSSEYLWTHILPRKIRMYVKTKIDGY